MNEVIIRTSERDWFRALAKAYKQKIHVLIIDDANVGIDPSSENLF